MDTHAAQALIRFGLGRRGAGAVARRPGRLAAGPACRAGPGSARPDRCGRVRRRSGRTGRTSRRPGTPNPIGTCSRARWMRWSATRSPRPRRSGSGWSGSGPTTSPSACATAAPARSAAISSAPPSAPNVTGRFGDMLLAVMRHPAMLLYLDNAGSVGPNSPVGLRSGKGLNENLARECLELHTVSPASGYTQADVTSFARVITGWSVANGETEPAGFRFRPDDPRAGRADRARPHGAGRRGRGASRRSPSWPPIRRLPPPGDQAGAAFRGRHPAARRGAPGSRRCCTTPAATWPGRGGAGGPAGGVAAARQAAHPAGLRAGRDARGRPAGRAPAGRPAIMRGWASRCSARRSRSAGRTARSTGPGRRR